MRSIDIKIATEANYTLCKMDDYIAYSEAYDQLQSLFARHRSICVKGCKCSIPYYWAPTVLEAARKIVAIDSKTVFVNIKEKNSKLFLDLWYESASEHIQDIIYQVKNDIDQLVHDRVRKVLVQRKFNYVPEGFHQLIPEKYN